MELDHIKRLLKAIEHGTPYRDLQILISDSKAILEKEIEFLAKDHLNLKRISNKTSLKDFSSVEEFYNYLTAIPIECSKLASIIWAKVYRDLSSIEKEALLSYVAQDNQLFWSLSHCISDFLKRITLESEFAAQWFLKIADIVKNDMMAGRVLEAIENYIYQNPDLGWAILKIYLQGINELNLHLSALILGTLRYHPKMNAVEEGIKTVDKNLSSSKNCQERVCYQRSWIISFVRYEVSDEQLLAVINEAVDGNEEEKIEAFDIAGKCLRFKINQTAFLTLILNWLNKNCSDEIPSVAKIIVINLLKTISPLLREKIHRQAFYQIIFKLQPISEQQNSTWQVLEEFLVSEFNRDQKSFYSLFRKVLDLNQDALPKKIRGEGMKTLCNEIAEQDSKGALLQKLLNSTNHLEVKLGVALFLIIGTALPFSSKTFAKLPKQNLILLFHEFILASADREVNSKFLLLLSPHFEKLTGEEREEFSEELFLQAINFPQSCLKIWEQEEDLPEIIREAVVKAESYFKSMANLEKSPAKSFGFPGFKMAAVKGTQEFSHAISESAHKNSIFMRLARHIDCIYGDGFTTVAWTGGEVRVNAPTPLKAHKFTLPEIPRIELIDPEGMALRRIFSSKKIREFYSQNV